MDPDLSPDQTATVAALVERLVAFHAELEPAEQAELERIVWASLPAPDRFALSGRAEPFSETESALVDRLAAEI
ncbi:MAG: hypothetical protein R2770_19430 [Acidimicrobiales bacterium]